MAMDDATKRSVGTLKGNYTREMKTAVGTEQQIAVYDKYAEKFAVYNLNLKKPEALRDAIDKRDFPKMKKADKFRAVLRIIGIIFKSEADAMEAIEKTKDAGKLKELLTSTFAEITGADLAHFSEEQIEFLKENGYTDRKAEAQDETKPAEVTYEVAAAYGAIMCEPEADELAITKNAVTFFAEKNGAADMDLDRLKKAVKTVIRLFSHKNVQYLTKNVSGTYTVNANAEV